MYTPAPLALNLNVKEQLISKAVIILNLNTCLGRPLITFSHANHDSSNKCAFCHKKGSKPFILESHVSSLTPPVPVLIKAPHDYRRLHLYEKLTGLFLSAAEQ
jgi:hypothetical protein